MELPGKVSEGKSCYFDDNMCGRPGSEELYCNKNLTCDDGKCKSGESREMCEKVPYFCPPNTIISK